nr:MAG TPA: hypothetical protein [Caudoviricetes sp.]
MKLIFKVLVTLIHVSLISIIVGIFSLTGLHYLYEWINKISDYRLKKFLDKLED